tara:strand:+ start:1756 stop:2538 length:783 start_codon:yes stop_codon:yes gene_type:complete
MKIAFVLTLHQSQERRPDGFKLIDRHLTSMKKSVNSKFDYSVFLFDNTSEEEFDLSKYSDMDIRYEYVEDQTLRGNTGPWNDGALAAYNDGFDKIYISSDDIILNESINYMFDETKEDDVFYGPTCQPGGILGQHIQIQTSQGNHILDGTGGAYLNGFFFGFTRTFYEKFRIDEKNIFSPSKSHIWGGNEEEIQERLWKRGVRSHVITKSWIYHEKIRGWKYFFGQRVSQEDYDNLSKQRSHDYEVNWKPFMESIKYESN